MKVRFYLLGTILVLTSILAIRMFTMNVQADQVIMVDVMYFIPDKSEFILDDEKRKNAVDEVIKKTNGNVWDIFEDKNALGGTALGAPGDNDFGTNFPLVYKLPVAIKAGEGGPWKMWARLNRTADPNSFWWKASQNASKWTPPGFNIDTHGWNNPGAPLNIPDKPPWFWFDGIGNPDFKPGDNYLMLSNRESGVPPNVNLIDVISIRNDGKKPSDEEAEKLLAEQYKGIRSPFEKVEESVSPGGKLTTTWGRLKGEY
ncbi:TPA: hypothetical protein EYP66_13500 [Candidatus Poribacteria bacterium]|nr:hypothetical protein [Candidatus Poribacteria bacterium]